MKSKKNERSHSRHHSEHPSKHTRHGTHESEDSMPEETPVSEIPSSSVEDEETRQKNQSDEQREINPDFEEK